MKAVVGNDPVDREVIYGALSCIFWTLTLQTTVKYVILTLQADNKGEGGIFSLYTLVRRVKLKWLVFPTIIGGSALLADGVITPAISVSSAVEGLRYFNSEIDTVPFVIAIITGLFIIQQFGTKFVGKFFGPGMLVWFLMIGILGAMSISHHPEVLASLNPYYGCWAPSSFAPRAPRVCILTWGIAAAKTSASAGAS